MKNQYVGDINDYCKYGLLRALTGGGALRSGVAWMLTPDDGSRDGRKLSYLGAPAVWRARDPALFDALSTIATTETMRSVDAVAASGLLPGAVFHADVVPRDRTLRRAHFERTLEVARGVQLLFFDPDNGIEIQSCPAGRGGSEKYLLWTELQAAYAAGHSVLVYQHFPRSERGTFTASLARRIVEAVGAREVIAFRTPNVAFLLAPQIDATISFRSEAQRIEAAWCDVMTVDWVAGA